jgi:pyruvate,orthophosphate dikinase
MTGVVHFGAGAPASEPPPVDMVGGKAWHLIRLAGAGLPVPTGFVVPTSVCRRYYEAGGRLPDGFVPELQGELARLEQRTGKTFGRGRRPLLVSVRSGSAASMPGMMDTLLDVGLTPGLEPALLRATGNARVFWDSLRRLVRSFAETVRGADPAPFEDTLAARLASRSVSDLAELDVAALRALTTDWLALYQKVIGEAFPMDPDRQLQEAFEAVYRSWRSERAVRYRAMHGLDDAAGTAAIVQAMVFGNRGGDSGAGVGFTRDPATGEPGLYLDFLFGAQGEDVVSGRRTASGAGELARLLPVVHAQLAGIAERLERLFGDVQDFEFTLEQGQLYLLQSRNAKRTPLAALRIACDLVREGLIMPAEALTRLAGLDLEGIVETRVAAVDGATVLGQGTPASGGVASGPVALDSATAVTLTRRGQIPILVRAEMSTSDLAGMEAAGGILTVEGSRTSHAALVARELGRVAVVGCRGLVIDPIRRELKLGGRTVQEGDTLSLDGGSGVVYAGPVRVERRRPTELLDLVAGWHTTVRAERELAVSAGTGS